VFFHEIWLKQLVFLEEPESASAQFRTYGVCRIIQPLIFAKNRVPVVPGSKCNDQNTNVLLPLSAKNRWTNSATRFTGGR
jgi:hypothetical protein